LQPEDLIKITSSLLEQGHMTDNLKQNMIDHIYDNLNELNYEVLAELAVVYATKMDKTYKELFF